MKVERKKQVTLDDGSTRTVTSTKTEILYRCALEASVSVDIARRVIFDGGAVDSAPRRRAWSWALANGILKPAKPKTEPAKALDEIDALLNRAPK